MTNGSKARSASCGRPAPAPRTGTADSQMTNVGSGLPTNSPTPCGTGRCQREWSCGIAARTSSASTTCTWKPSPPPSRGDERNCDGNPQRLSVAADAPAPPKTHIQAAVNAAHVTESRTATPRMPGSFAEKGLGRIQGYAPRGDLLARRTLGESPDGAAASGSHFGFGFDDREERRLPFSRFLGAVGQDHDVPERFSASNDLTPLVAAAPHVRCRPRRAARPLLRSESSAPVDRRQPQGRWPARRHARRPAARPPPRLHARPCAASTRQPPRSTEP